MPAPKYRGGQITGISLNADYLRLAGAQSSARSSRIEQWQQTTLAVQRHQVVAPTDMGRPDEDLRHGASTRYFHHFHPFLRLAVNPDFFNTFHAFGQKQTFGLYAIRANCGGIHLDGLHGINLFQREGLQRANWPDRRPGIGPARSPASWQSPPRVPTGHRTGKPESRAAPCF